MALVSLIGRASASIYPIAIRSVASRRAIHGAISAVHSEKPTADVDTLVRVLESEIKSVEQRGDVDDIPDVVTYRTGSTYLRRNYQDEKISVQFFNVKHYGGNFHVPPSLELHVSISKGDKNMNVHLNTSRDDEIAIEDVTINGFHQQFNNLDENLHKAFHKYLEIRGIKDSCLRNLLLEFKRNYEKEKDLRWLKRVKAFMEK